MRDITTNRSQDKEEAERQIQQHDTIYTLQKQLYRHEQLNQN